VVVESTYGDRQHPEEPAGDVLAKAVHEIVERKSILLIPSFAVGRTQQLIYQLHKLEQAKAIPIVPIYVDSPMAIDATNIFMAHPEDHRLTFRRQEEDHNKDNHPFHCERLAFVRSPQQSATLDMMNGPAIIISASGMATGGRVLNHLEAYLPDPNAVVLFAGFQAAGTRGRSLVDGAEAIKMHGRMVPVRAQIRTLDSMSAHGDAGDVLRWLGTIQKPPRKVFIVHGEPTASETLAQRIRQQYGFETYIPHYGEVVPLQGD
jgi:metallo-beta-lactamase family protein